MTRGASTTKILVCEDDEGILEVVSLLLQTEGYKSVPAADLESMLRAVETSRPAIVLLDLTLGGENAEQYIDKIVSPEGPHVILMSAQADIADIAVRHDVDHITKPFSIDELKSAIERNLKK